MRGRLATILMTFGAAALVLSTMGEATPAYIWNASKSVPIGLYRLQPAGRLAVTELVAVRPPEPLATFLDLNGYLPIGVPMLKRVLALPGQTVCRKGLTISVDAIDMGEALSRDGRGRPLAGLARMSRRWRGRTLSHELAIGRLSGRPLLRASFRNRPSSARRCPCGPERSDRDRPCPIKSVIPLFDRSQHHSSVPARLATAVARSGGPGRPRGRRKRALPWTAASTMAALPASSGQRRVFRALLTTVLPFDAWRMSSRPFR